MICNCKYCKQQTLQITREDTFAGDTKLLLKAIQAFDCTNPRCRRVKVVTYRFLPDVWALNPPPEDPDVDTDPELDGPSPEVLLAELDDCSGAAAESHQSGR